MKYFYFVLILITLILGVIFGYDKLKNGEVEDKLKFVQISVQDKVKEKQEERYVSPISIDYLRSLKIETEKLNIERLVSENTSI